MHIGDVDEGMVSGEPTTDVYLSSQPRDPAGYAMQTSARNSSRCSRPLLLPPRLWSSRDQEWPLSQKVPSCIWAFRDDKGL